MSQNEDGPVMVTNPNTGNQINISSLFTLEELAGEIPIKFFGEAVDNILKMVVMHINPNYAEQEFKIFQQNCTNLILLSAAFRDMKEVDQEGRDI